MRCPNKLELQSLLDDELLSWQSRAIERHLAACPDCQAKTAGLQEIINILQQGMGKETLPEIETRHRFFRPAYAAAAAVLFIFLFTAGYFVEQQQNKWSPEAQLMQEYLTIYTETVSSPNRI
jgi:hypothetical protein